MKQFNIVLYLLLVGLIVITSCNESSLIGSDIIISDQVNVKVKELTFKATTMEADSVQTYRTTEPLNDFICGYMEDPLFGTYESIFNTQLRLSSSLTFADSIDIENIANGGLDSAFLVIELNDEFYGQIGSDQSVEVYLLDEAMDNNAIYHSEKEFLAGDLLGAKTFTPSVPDSSVFYTNTNNDGSIDTIKPPQIQIPLDINHPLFTDILFAGENSLQYFSDDALLLDVFNGIQVKVATATPNEGLMIFDPVPASTTIPSVTGLYVYYKSISADSRVYTFAINEDAAKMVNFIPDNSGTALVEPFIDDTALGDSLIFIQGMSGLNAKLEIQDFSSLQDVIINKAEIEFTIASNLPEDKTIFSSDPISQLFLATQNTDGEFENISDLEAAIEVARSTSGIVIASIFGGIPVEVNSTSSTPLLKYKMNITSYLQELVNGEHDNAEIFIYPAFRAEIPERVVLFGPGHSEHPAKIYVTYTENQ